MTDNRYPLITVPLSRPTPVDGPHIHGAPKRPVVCEVQLSARGAQYTGVWSGKPTARRYNGRGTYMYLGDVVEGWAWVAELDDEDRATVQRHAARLLEGAGREPEGGYLSDSRLVFYYGPQAKTLAAPFTVGTIAAHLAELKRAAKDPVHAEGLLALAEHILSEITSGTLWSSPDTFLYCGGVHVEAVRTDQESA